MDKLSARIRNRREQAVETFGSVKQAIGQLERGMALFGITRGQFSMIDIIIYLICELGRVNVSVWTWAIADYEVEVFTRLMRDQRICSAILVVDYSAGKRNPGLLRDWREIYGEQSVRVCMNHAKIARVWSDDWHFLARGSMNLNFNPRFEQFDLSEGGEEFDLVREIEEELKVLKVEHSKAEAKAVTKLDLAFSPETLRIFEGNKVWRP